MEAEREQGPEGRSGATSVELTPTPPPAPVARPVVRITPEIVGWQPLDLPDLWRHRELMYFLIWRQVKADFRQMALGPLWLGIRPILSVVIYTLIFSAIAKLASDGIPYPLFSFSAVILWTF